MICDSHHGEYVSVGLLGCNTISTCREMVCFSETLLSICKSTWHSNTEDKNWHILMICSFCQLQFKTSKIVSWEVQYQHLQLQTPESKATSKVSELLSITGWSIFVLSRYELGRAAGLFLYYK